MIGVVADDLTGAHDIGSMFVRSGARVHVFAWPGGDGGTASVARGAASGRDESAGEESVLGNGGREPAVGKESQPASEWNETMLRLECSIRQWPLPDVLVLDTNSRFDDPEVAYQKVWAATRLLQKLGCTRFYKKTCSAFRGNIGRELDAVLDATGEELAVVVAGFPKNGRQTIGGIHYIRGVKLEDSEFRNDPVHPMRRSNLVELLQEQTPRKVGLITHDVMERGPEVLLQEVENARGRCQYVILDVVDQESLKVIARALHGLPVLAGSSALAEELPVPSHDSTAPAVNEATSLPLRSQEGGGIPCERDGHGGHGERGEAGIFCRQDGHGGHGERDEPAILRKQDGGGVLCAAGSLMPQTAAQVDFMRRAGCPVFELDPRRLFDGAGREEAIGRLVESMCTGLARGQDVVVHTSNDAQVVAETRALGQAHGLTGTALARHVSDGVAEVVARCVQKLELTRLLIAGGDTAAAVSARLGIHGMRVWREIEPGIASCISLTEKPLFLVLKPGGFGGPDFFARAVAHLRGE